ncbi:hypothetical protein AOLI_G00309300 [Acnodon oligacanthus]
MLLLKIPAVKTEDLSHRWFVHISHGEMLKHVLFSGWAEANELSSLSVHMNDSLFIMMEDFIMGNELLSIKPLHWLPWVPSL